MFDTPAPSPIKLFSDPVISGEPSFTIKLFSSSSSAPGLSGIGPIETKSEPSYAYSFHSSVFHHMSPRAGALGSVVDDVRLAMDFQSLAALTFSVDVVVFHQS